MKTMHLIIFRALFVFAFASATVSAGVNRDQGQDLLSKKLQWSAPANNYVSWFAKRTEDLCNAGQIIQTTHGPVQVMVKGYGPIILALHGGFGGWDQGLEITSHLIDKGFSVISVSRPGYLGTPLSALPTLADYNARQQADVLAALLKAMNIPKVSVLGFSAGAPVAYEFAKNYPGLVSACVLESLGANPNEDSLFYGVLGAFLNDPSVPDFMSYMLSLAVNDDFASLANFVIPRDTNLTGMPLEDRAHGILANDSERRHLKKILLSSLPVSPRLQGTLIDCVEVDYWTTTFNPSGFATPTLIVQAVDDSNGLFPIAQAVQSQLPTSQLIPVYESGHFIWFGPHTKSWEKKLVQFLRDHKS